ncbi:TonB-dependent receptor [Mucilaginibacter ginkgonis]|uniref:TonB-dependent receptor n=1 Tax=Mucilaginibacter ginkgonis TaxID=2682091 RepID=A0A6I4INB3_9SPHI|nr:TonB-dependent receptor [Mucilaginibacter ginkgonis]QQL49594.1 TonB-dependent receptor [Mucilaginibacter ginkgonis]
MTCIIKHLAVLIFWVLMGMVCHAQTVKGTVQDSLGKPVPYATISLKNTGNLILSYTTTTEKGNFEISVPKGADRTGLRLEVTSVGFKKETRQVQDLSIAYNFKLAAAIHQLQTVTIKDKNPRLRVSGDTLSYKVSDFTNPQDRVIGDVIKKLPGIDVDKNGKISYNGKAISNLYIGGDNLLDDKYNIATSSIPHGVVDQVQVMQNHQPIKMLQNKVVSDDVALNLTIKKEAKMQVVGQETIGAGLPGNYYADLNAMAFKDKYKAINYFKGNNVGIDVSNDLIAHNQEAFMSRLDNDRPGTILSLGTAGDPDLPRSRYLLNRSGLLNLNNLVTIKKEVQLRANISYFRDSQRQDYRKLSEIYLPNDTVRYSETQVNKNRPDILHAQFMLNMNKSKYYLNDNFSADYSHYKGYSSLVSNGIPVNQVLSDNLTNFSNEFDYRQTLKGNTIVNLYSYINHSTEPENRVIDPNLNPSVFNNNIAYNQLTQTANIPTWFSNNYLSLAIPRDWVTQTYKAGITSQSQQLNSALSVTQLNNSVNLLSDSALNHLNWSRQKFYTEAVYDFPGTKLKANITLPLSLQNTSYNDSFYNLDERLTRLYFSPTLFVKYMTGIENFVTANYSLRNNIGNIQDVYRGYILTNYRSLYANNADLSERQTQNASVGFNYRKAIVLFFFSLNAGYTHVNINNIASSVITNNITRRIVLPFDNNINSWNFSGNISKYDFGLKTTFSAAASYQTTKLNQILNSQILPYTTRSTLLSFGADTRISPKVNTSYHADYLITESNSSAVAGSNKFQRLTQRASVNYNPTNNLFLSLSGDYYYTHQPGANDLKYPFADASLRYHFLKTKLDLEVTAQNLLNTQNYTAVYLSANVYSASTYTIPGRILLAKVLFNL